MGQIYTPKGKAREYGAYALNLYDGCSHGCQYCFVPAVLHRTREAFGHAMLRKIDWAKLEREIKALPAKSEVFLCFTCDPYQVLDEAEKRTRRTIDLFHSHGVGVRILTKAGSKSTRDFDLLSARPELSSYGTTLTFTNVYDEVTWEPGAGTYFSRIGALREAHRQNIQTWVSMEPVVDPKQSLELIEMAAPFTDSFKIGRWNHDQRSNEIDWNTFVRDAVDLLCDLHKSYYIKQETRPFLPAGYPAESKGR